jgi:crotonobetainyl-CoA:carnitine CoA-transferase CaiB-like acyl-CoA transferase
MNTVAPLACRQLGALGADVIKVEPPAGDSNRINVPLREDQESYIFALSNTDKRGVVLDLKNPDDAEVLWSLLARADVVMENLKPGSLGKLGFGADAVLQKHPSIVYCSVNGFGYATAYPGRPALDTVIQAMSGAMSVTLVDGVPTKTGISISDQFGGQFGLVGILAALESRRSTGRGLHLDIAMQDCSVWATHTVWNASGSASRTQVIPIKGGHAIVEGAPLRITEFVQSNDGDLLEGVKLLAKAKTAGLEAVRVSTVDEVIGAAQTIARGLLVTVPTADGSEWRVLESPLKLLNTPAVVGSAMATLGFAYPDLFAEYGLTSLGDRRTRSPALAAAEA